MDINALKENRTKLHQQAQGLVDLAAKENRELTDVEQKSFDGLIGQVEAADASIARAEKLAALGAVNKPEQPKRKTAPDAIGQSVEGGRLRAADDPKKGFRNTREFFTGVMQTAQNGGRLTDERLSLVRADILRGELMNTAGSDEQGIYADPYGGFLLPEGFTPNLMQVNPETDPMGAMVARIPMSTLVVNIPARVDKNHTNSVSGGLRVYRRAETDTSASSRQEYEKVKLEATCLMGIAYASEELLALSPISFVALLDQGFRSEFPAKILDERLNGTGAGEFQGCLNAPCKVTVAKETGQAATTIVWQNVLKMRSRAWNYGQSIWLYNHDTLPQLMQMYQPIGASGTAMWQMGGQTDRPDTILGRPAYPTEFAQTLGTEGDLVLCTCSEYLEGTLQPLQSAESIHVRFVNNERCFRFHMYNAGACWWRSALTPKKSTTTLSCIVTLATRA